MSSSSTECVASPRDSRAASSSDKIGADSALVSLMPQQSSSMSCATLAAAAPVSVITPLLGPSHSCVAHISNGKSSSDSGEAGFLCLSKPPTALEGSDGAAILASGFATPPSQVLSPSTPSGNTAGRRCPLDKTTPSAPVPTHHAFPTTAVATAASPLSLSRPRPVPSPTPRRVTVPSGSALTRDFAQRLRSCVQKQRSCSAPYPGVCSCGTSPAVASAVAAPAAAMDASTVDDGDASSSGSSSDAEIRAKEARRAKTSAVQPTVAAAQHLRHAPPTINTPISPDPHPVDTFNVSSLAQYAFNHSVASITTRPPATASSELVKRKVNGVSYINDYRIAKTLGKGACGKVKLAYDETEGRWVAIKVVRRADSRKRIGGLTTAQKQYNAFMREIEVMKKLRHRNIVSLYEVIDDPTADKLYLVMQYVDKGVVAKVEVRANSDFVCDPIPPAQLARYTREMLTGLQYLHAHDVVHRDLKPDNILVSKNGHAYLADFGVAETFDTSYRQRMESLMAQSVAMSMAMSVAGGRAGGPQVLGTKGTPLFIAPELWSGTKSYGKPVDMWAMGVTLFTLLVGKLPFRSPEDITDAQYTPTVPEEFGEKWRVLLKGLLNRDPRTRWTVEKARAYVQHYLDGTSDPPLEERAASAGAAEGAATFRPLSMGTSAPARRAAIDEAKHQQRQQQQSCADKAMNVAAGALDASVITASSPHSVCGREDKQISFSDTGSHDFNVDFLPMPDSAEDALTPELTSAPPLPSPAIQLIHTVIAIPPSRTQAEAAAGGNVTTPSHKKRGGGVADDDDIDGDDECNEAKFNLTSAFTSPFDRSPAMARALSGNFTMGHSVSNINAQLLSPLASAQSGKMAPLPPHLAMQHLPTVQIGEVSGPRGRRTQHRRSNASISATRSATRSKSREDLHLLHARHHRTAPASVAAPLMEVRQRKERPMSGQSQARISVSGGSSPAASARLIPHDTPPLSLHQSFDTPLDYRRIQ
jgi:serine/threonine protein kinase